MAGLFATRSGLGRAADLICRGLEHAGARLHRVDLSPDLQLAPERADATISPGRASTFSPSDLVLVLNPPLAYDALRLFDRSWIQERCIVGHWVWELDRLPRSWIQSAASFDEIWAPSSFVEQTLRRHLGEAKVALRLHPYPTDLDAFGVATPQERAAARARLGLAPGTLCVGYSFSAASNYERKNPEGAVEAFLKAFPNPGDEAALVLRALDLDGFPQGRERLQRLAASHPEIHLVGSGANALSIREFYAAIDVYVAPFRAEGYGLNLVEAVQAGKRVVATGWSLGEDIAGLPGVTTVGYALVPVIDRQGHYPGSRDALWAEPDLDSMAEHLRALQSGWAEHATPRL